MNHDQPSILLAQGHSSALVAGALRHVVVPALGDELARRLEQPGACFLDVGAGVAALAIAACRLWPSLQVVALDPWEPALAIAREQVAAAGMQERIEVRDGVIEELEDADGFDLAWLPTFFIPRPALEPAIERIFAVMRPGGWATFGLYHARATHSGMRWPTFGAPGRHAHRAPRPRGPARARRLRRCWRALRAGMVAAVVFVAGRKP